MAETILVTQRVTIDAATGERRDALDQRWTAFLEALGYQILMVPNGQADIGALVSLVSPAAIILTGGNDLAAYGGDAPERDKTEARLIELAALQEIPLIGVCRGMQLIQHLSGTKLEKMNDQVAKEMPVVVDGETCQKNSYHTWGTFDETHGYKDWAKTSNGVVKAILSSDKMSLGIMWHPERNSPFDPEDIILFRDFIQKDRG